MCKFKTDNDKKLKTTIIYQKGMFRCLCVNSVELELRILGNQDLYEIYLKKI